MIEGVQSDRESLTMMKMRMRLSYWNSQRSYYNGSRLHAIHGRGKSITLALTKTCKRTQTRTAIEKVAEIWRE
jgi:hypothetical protein